MKPVTQTKRGGKDAAPEDRGDCFDACLASVLEVPIEAVHVPHDEEWWQHAIDVVAAHGHRLLPVYNPEALPEGEKYTAAKIGEWLGDVYWLACVPSFSLAGERHEIVMRAGDVAHDPGLGERLYAAGPLPDDVEVFDAMLLVPLADAAPAANRGGWTFTAEDLKEVEDNFGCTAQEGWEVDEDVLEKLRAIVDRPMVAAALAREGWRPRLGWIEQLLRGAIAGHELAADAPHTFRRGEVADLQAALVEVRAMLDGSSGAEPWQRRLAVVEAKLREVHRDVEVKSMFYSVEVLDEVLDELRKLIDA